MKKIFGVFLGVLCWINVLSSYAAEKYEILPDLPEPLAAAQASSAITDTNSAPLTSNMVQTVGQEPSIISVVFSLLFVILLIYATGIIYTKLNKVGFKALKKQIGDSDSSRVSVISTTPLGSNKTLHVVELDGKRMLIGASANAIDLIKDLGAYPPADIEEGEFSKIEIPNIRIPKIEIPKIEFPNIGFTKASKKVNSEDDNSYKSSEEKGIKEDEDGFIISDIYEESPDGIIDKLFTQPQQKQDKDDSANNVSNEKNIHKIDPDDYALYKKYL